MKVLLLLTLFVPTILAGCSSHMGDNCMTEAEFLASPDAWALSFFKDAYGFYANGDDPCFDYFGGHVSIYFFMLFMISKVILF